ncbi:Receptor protein kinase CLAVATA1 [Linum perenne]
MIGVGGHGLHDWQTSESPSAHCSFSGVICDKETLRVVSLNVSFQKFSGSLPPEIGLLNTLININISGNNVSDEIPPEIVNCTSLISIDFSRNKLSGEIPPGIIHLKNLNHLDLSENQLTGGVPDAIQYMSSLTSLNLSGNKLTGRVPDGGQFQVFDESSYAGNPGLCFPGNGTSCSSRKATTIHSNCHRISSFSIVKLVMTIFSLYYLIV